MAKNLGLKNLKQLESPLAIDYDEEEDILFLYFTDNRPCVAYDITEKIIARVDPKTDELVSIEIFDFRKDLKTKTPADLPKKLVGE
jgi:uncharacterized protein YuzE